MKTAVCFISRFNIWGCLAPQLMSPESKTATALGARKFGTAVRSGEGAMHDGG